MAACATLVGCSRPADPPAPPAPSAAPSAAAPGATASRVTLRGDEVTFQGQPAGSLSRLGGTTRLQRSDGLYVSARAARVAWTEAHPKETFPGLFELEVPADAPAAWFSSLFFTMGMAGYPQARVLVGGEVLSLEIDLDQPRGPTPRQRVRLEVTQEPTVTTLAWTGTIMDGMDLGPPPETSALVRSLPPPTRLAGALPQAELQAALRTALRAAPASADRPLVVAPLVNALADLVAVARAADTLRREGLEIVVTPRRR